MMGWGVVSLMMTATPLSMIGCGLKFNDAAFVVQWHILGMWVPSFFSGALIGRYGGARIMLIGAVLMIGCVMAALAGFEVWNFWLANVLVGIGWTFLFVSATVMLTETYAPDERAKVQGFNDFGVFGTVAFTTFTSGWLQNVYGWATVNYSVAPFLALVIVAILWLFARTRTAPAAAGEGLPLVGNWGEYLRAPGRRWRSRAPGEKSFRACCVDPRFSSGSFGSSPNIGVAP